MQHFDPDFGFEITDQPFEEIWTPPSDCTGEELIDLASLPNLSKLKKIKKNRKKKKNKQASAKPANIP